ncbi:unnamed protein product [Polarella glacialis]|uniref:Uncharacterized protein n=1 Tax=Polarella glacialis TaxID=89957 RepID=A0A813GBP9_POLGL|nr:unnamed protein product [Polarella glacialis]
MWLPINMAFQMLIKTVQVRTVLPTNLTLKTGGGDKRNNPIGTDALHGTRLGANVSFHCFSDMLLRPCFTGKYGKAPRALVTNDNIRCSRKRGMLLTVVQVKSFGRVVAFATFFATLSNFVTDMALNDSHN